jgi:hypothetical protein
MADLRRKTERPVTSMIWNGDPERAREIGAWARDKALNARWQWRPKDTARVLVQLGEDQGQEWAPVPLGAVIRRDPTDADGPLVLVLPPEPHEYVPA